MGLAALPVDVTAKAKGLLEAPVRFFAFCYGFEEQSDRTAPPDQLTPNLGCRENRRDFEPRFFFADRRRPFLSPS